MNQVGAPGSIGGSRRLLARLRDVMAGSGTVQSRLDRIVQLIAAELRAEVCSCYIMRPGEVLELFATVGLNPRAVHNTRLRVGEGVVGEVAATATPMALADAPAHPSFAYRPETGEDPYHSLLGVPILRGGKVRGVLDIQTRERRHHTEEEVETLQTVAMVVAELLAGGESAGPGVAASGPVAGVLPVRLEGSTLNGGMAEGLAVLHRPQITARQLVADNPRQERRRFRAAIAAMHSSLDALLARTAETGAGESHAILESYRMFAQDQGWMNRILEAINTGLTAEAAVQRVQNDMAVRMARVTDPYLRERLLDFDDLANRVLMHLAGRGSVAAGATLPDAMVLVARNLGPAELLDYDRSRLRALVLEDGSATSHVAIVAKTLDIPVVGRCAEAMSQIEPFDPVIVDGDAGQVLVRPAEDVQEAFQENFRLRARRHQEYAAHAHEPAVTRDGVRIGVQLNASLLVDLSHLESTGADGVGLFRTEVPFMVRAEFPSVGEQTLLYAQVLDRAGDRPVVFRTLDIGGDKTLPYFTLPEQANPAMGWRAIRIGLDRPALLRQQIRAILRAADGRPVAVMFPMIAEIAEFAAARRLLDMEYARAAREGHRLPATVKVGVMIEVPALLWQLPALLRRVDFAAVGSNDLSQYLFAADRGNPKVGHRYDPLAPALLNALAWLFECGESTGVPVSLCGEIAGRPLDAMAVIGLGCRQLSMAPANVGAVKAMIRSLKLDTVIRYLELLKGSEDHCVRERLRAFAIDHGVQMSA